MNDNFDYEHDRNEAKATITFFDKTQIAFTDSEIEDLFWMLANVLDKEVRDKW